MQSVCSRPAEPQAVVERVLADEAATARLAAEVAARARAGDVIALCGPLGAGKTAFARGFIRALGGTEEVPSPTFTLVQTYPLGAATVWHFDLFRLEAAAEAWELGIEEAFTGGISLIEWPERLAGLLPADRLEVILSITRPGRRARLVGRGSWAGRLPAGED